MQEAANLTGASLFSTAFQIKKKKLRKIVPSTVRGEGVRDPESSWVLSGNEISYWKYVVKNSIQ